MRCLNANWKQTDAETGTDAGAGMDAETETDAARLPYLCQTRMAAMLADDGVALGNEKGWKPDRGREEREDATTSERGMRFQQARWKSQILPSF